MSESETTLLTLTEAARLLGLAPATLRYRTEHGKGPIPTKVEYTYGRPSKDGMQYRYSLSEIERYVRNDADPETAMAYWLGTLWMSLRALTPDELNATNQAVASVLAELRQFPRVAAVWASVGMALLADARARGVEITEPAPAADDDAALMMLAA